MDEEKENSDVAGSNSGELSKSLLNVSFCLEVCNLRPTRCTLNSCPCTSLAEAYPSVHKAGKFIYIYKTSLKVSLHLKQIKAKRTVRDQVGL